MLKTQIKDNQLFAKLTSLSNWSQNPKAIKLDEFSELKKSLKEEGQLMPMLINTGEHWGEEGVVLGGNMTFRGLLDNSETEGWIKLVSPKDEAHALKIALKHNAQYGYYDIDLLAEFAVKYSNDEDIQRLQVHLAYPTSLEALGNSFGPGGVDPTKLPAPTYPTGGDNTNLADLSGGLKTDHECPSCGYKW